MSLSHALLSDHWTDGKPRIGFLRRTRFKLMPRWAFRHITGLRTFHPVVITRRKTVTNPSPEVSVVLLKKRHRSVRTFYQKHILRVPRRVYKAPAEVLPLTVKECDLKLLHIFYGPEAIKYLPGLQSLNLPVTVSFHGWDLSDCLNVPEYSAKLPALFQIISCFMVRSEFMRQKLLGGGCPEAKIWINRAGIPLERFPLKQRTRGGSFPTFVQVCRLTRKKGLLTSLEAFRRVAQQIPQARFLVAGEGPLRAEVESFIQDHSLQNSVRLLGFLDEDHLVRVLHEADVFVHPSFTTPEGDEEGIPNALLEAMATGLPPIVTRHAGMPEVVAEGRTGWLVEERAADQLAEKMLWVSAHPEVLDEIGLRARKVIEEDYALDKRMRLLDEKYRQLIAEYPYRPQSGRKGSIAQFLRVMARPHKYGG